MTISLSPMLIALGAIAVLLLGIVLAICTRRPIIQRLEDQRRDLAAQLDSVAHELHVVKQEKQAADDALADMRRELATGTSRSEQLRDLVKIHVARRREFDEWAGPIKASLGESVGQALRTLKDQLLRQESVLQRQEKLVAQTQDQYRAKADEIERMRRELSIKNYHIAALNERFIRIEERISDLSLRAAGGGTISERVDAAMTEPASPGIPQPTAPQLPLNMIEKPAADWTQLLDEWHKRLDRRFGQLDALQANLQDRLANPPAELPPYPEPQDGPERPTIQ